MLRNNWLRRVLMPLALVVLLLPGPLPGPTDSRRPRREDHDDRHGAHGRRAG